MSLLQDLQIEENNVEIYTTAYVKVSNYKCLRIISTFTNAGYLYVYHSIDGKTDSLTNTYICNNKSSLQKVEVVCDYIRLCITTMNQNEIIDKVSVSVKGRRSVNSNLFNLLEKFQSPQLGQEVEKEVNLLEPPKEERASGLYRRLGIHVKPKEKELNNHSVNCRCKIIPELLLSGHILYCKNMGRLEVLAPPVADSKNYVLCMNNKTPFYMSIEDLHGSGWFKQ